MATHSIPRNAAASAISPRRHLSRPCSAACRDIAATSIFFCLAQACSAMVKAAPSPISSRSAQTERVQTAQRRLAVFSRPIGGIVGIALQGYLSHSQAGIGHDRGELRGQGNRSAPDPGHGQDGIESCAKQAHINQLPCRQAQKFGPGRELNYGSPCISQMRSLGQECKARRY